MFHRKQCKTINTKNSNKPNGWRQTYQKASATRRNSKTKEKIKKAKKRPLSGRDLTDLLQNQREFIGVCASDQICNLKLHQFPCYFIINIAESSISNGHWIAIRISKSHVEIFDSLGCNPANWGHYPRTLLSFLQCYSYSHKFELSPVLQSSQSNMCGLYCVFFIVYRCNFSFSCLLDKFTQNLNKNDKILLHLLQNMYNI